jgi:hypothetical protein
MSSRPRDDPGQWGAPDAPIGRAPNATCGLAAHTVADQGVGGVKRDAAMDGCRASLARFGSACYDLVF